MDIDALVRRQFYIECLLGYVLSQYDLKTKKRQTGEENEKKGVQRRTLPEQIGQLTTRTGRQRSLKCHLQ